MNTIEERIESHQRTIRDSLAYKVFDLHVDLTEAMFDQLDALQLTQRGLAIRAGLKASYVNRILNNPGNLTLETVVKLAEALELDVKVLLKRKSESRWIKLPDEHYESLMLVEGISVDESIVNTCERLLGKTFLELVPCPAHSNIQSTQENDEFPVAA